jgi:hypothetical protein
MTARAWRHVLCAHTNQVYILLAEGNFWDVLGPAKKPDILVVEQYNCNMGYMNRGMRWKTHFNSHIYVSEQKIFFHLFELTILNSYNLLSSCCDYEMSQTEFYMCLPMNVLENSLVHSL